MPEDMVDHQHNDEGSNEPDPIFRQNCPQGMKGARH